MRNYNLFLQIFVGVTASLLNSDPKSGITIQETVAAAIGYNLVASNVALTATVTSPSSPSDAVVSYNVTGPSAPFGSLAAAYAAYSSALTTSIASGSFAATLTARAVANVAPSLTSRSVVPQQATIPNFLTAVPSVSPTSTPTYSGGKPTPWPTLLPTLSPSVRPVASPVYAAGSPSFMPTTISPPVQLTVVQVSHVILSPNFFINRIHCGILFFRQIITAALIVEKNLINLLLHFHRRP